NTEGRVQLANRASFPPGDAKEDWAILRALSEVVGYKLPYDTIDDVRAAIVKYAPHFAMRDVAAVQPGADPAIWTAIREARALDAAPLKSAIIDFYLTNPVARASETMAECSRIYVGSAKLAAE